MFSNLRVREVLEELQKFRKNGMRVVSGMVILIMNRICLGMLCLVVSCDTMCMWYHRMDKNNTNACKQQSGTLFTIVALHLDQRYRSKRLLQILGCLQVSSRFYEPSLGSLKRNDGLGRIEANPENYCLFTPPFSPFDH